MSLRRSFPIRENLKVQIAADASNLLNHAELSGAFNGGLGNTNLTNNPSGGLIPGYGNSATFGTGGVLPSGAPANSLASGNPVASEYAPIGEFFNSSSAADVLFVDLLRNTNSGFNNIYSFNVTAGFTTTIQNSTIEGQGSSGMVFDNAANTVRLNGYTLVSIRAEMPVTKDIALYVRVENLADEKYQTAAGYGSLRRAAYGGVRFRFN